MLTMYEIAKTHTNIDRFSAVTFEIVPYLTKALDLATLKCQVTQYRIKNFVTHISLHVSAL